MAVHEITPAMVADWFKEALSRGPIPSVPDCEWLASYLDSLQRQKQKGHLWERAGSDNLMHAHLANLRKSGRMSSHRLDREVGFARRELAHLRSWNFGEPILRVEDDVGQAGRLERLTQLKQKIDECSDLWDRTWPLPTWWHFDANKVAREAETDAALINVAGTLYGTTVTGSSTANCGLGAGGCGTVFSITPGGTENIIYAFKGASDGANPYASLSS
jgi:hypothetical protein